MKVEQPLANYNGKPQIEDGYTKIANELLEAIILFKFTERQYKVFFAILRKTYGFNKTNDDISLSQLSAICNLPINHVSTVIKQLVSLNIIIKAEGKHAHNLRINKHYDRWGLHNMECHKMELHNVDKGVTSLGVLPLHNMEVQNTTPKDNTKDNNNKGTRLPDDWIAPQEFIDFCNNERPDLDANFIAEQFKDYWIGVAGSKGIKRNWIATWRNWVRNQKKNQSEFKNKSQVITDEKFKNWLYKPDGKKYL